MKLLLVLILICVVVIQNTNSMIDKPEEIFYRGTSGWEYAFIALNGNKLIEGGHIANWTGEELGHSGDTGVSVFPIPVPNKYALLYYADQHSKLWNRLAPSSSNIKSELEYDKIVNNSPQYIQKIANTKSLEDMKACSVDNMELAARYKKNITALGQNKYNNLLEVLSIPIIMELRGEISKDEWGGVKDENRLHNPQLVKAYTTTPLSSSQEKAFNALNVPIPEVTSYFD